MLYFFLTVLALSAAATVANIKIRYDAKTPQLAVFGTRDICVFYSNPFEGELLAVDIVMNISPSNIFPTMLLLKEIHLTLMLLVTYLANTK